MSAQDDDLGGLSPFAPPELIEEAKAKAAARKPKVEPTVEPEPEVVPEPVPVLEPEVATRPVVAEATVSVGTAEVQILEEPQPAPLPDPVVAPVFTEDGIELADAPLMLFQPKPVVATPQVEEARIPAPLDSEATIVASGARAALPTEETFVAAVSAQQTASAPIVTSSVPIVEEESEIISTRKPVDANEANETARKQVIRTAPISETYERREIRPEVTRFSAQGKSREKLWQENAKRQKRASGRVLVWIIIVAAVGGSAIAIAAAMLSN